MKRTIIVLLMSVLFLSCHKLESGVVVKKHFEPSHSQLITTVISNGKTVSPYTYIIYVPDKWQITIEGEYRGKTRREDFSIPESDFRNINIGDFIYVDKIYERE